jgi:hypothetical protein
VVVLGGSALGDLQEEANVQRAEQSISQLDGESSRVALGNGEIARVSFGQLDTGASLVVDDGGWLRVTVRNATGGTVLANESLGRVVYRYNDRTVAYQGGGVWRSSGEGSRMVSPPEVHYRGTTLTLPIVSIDASGDERSGGTTAVVTDQGTSRVGGYENPLEKGSVNLTVRSSYYEAWGTYFEERTDGEVVYDHANRTTTLRLVTPSVAPTVTGAIVSGAASGDMIELDNDALISSYNSSEGDDPNAGVGRGNGPIYATGPVKLNSGNVRVRGDIYASDTVTFAGGDDPQTATDRLIRGFAAETGAHAGIIAVDREGRAGEAFNSGGMQTAQST